MARAPDPHTEAAKAYIRSILDQHGWDATTLARKAGLASTTLTRPLNDAKHAYGFTSKTLAKIAQASGIPLPAELGGGVVGSPPQIQSTYPQRARREHEKSNTESEDLGVHSDIRGRTPDIDIANGARNLPVYGTAVGGDHDKGFFLLNLGEAIEQVKRPARLSNVPKAFAIYLVGGSMYPRFRDGQRLYIHPGQHARIGDDVLVELYPEHEGESGAALVKELVARTPNKLKLRQFSPDKVIEVDLRRVHHVYRVIPYDELPEL